MRKLGADQMTLRTFAVTTCIALDLTRDYVCEGVVDLNIVSCITAFPCFAGIFNPFLFYQEILLHIIDSRPALTATAICGIVFQSGRCDPGSGPYLDWSININQNDATPINGSKTGPPESQLDELVVVHITDTHYDPNYREGATAPCGAPACCRHDQVHCAPM